jgi:hypothetical protein
MTQRRDLILHRPERALADEFGMTLEEVQQVLDEHPVERFFVRDWRCAARRKRISG